MVSKSCVTAPTIWQERQSVGYAPIDDEHERLFDLIQLLRDAVSRDNGREVLGYVLNELITFTQAHFASEERLMLDHHYPLMATHQARHVAATRRLVQLRAQFAAGRTPRILLVIQELEDWIADHIQVSDKALGSFLAAVTCEHASDSC